MSALTALFHRTGAPADEAATDDMLAPLKRYGPGRSESRADGPASLGCAQYISTPEARFARQPAISAGGRYIGAFDMRLTNRPDVIDSLGPGDWAKASDEALALALWDRWGVDAMDRMIGPLAALVWDRQDQTVTLARDPSGERPLCYHLTDKRLCAASYPRAIHALGGLDRRIDRMKFIDALSEFDIDIERSYFEGIQNVVPGGFVVVGRGTLTKQKFYDLRSRFKPVRYRNDDDYVEAARELLTQSIQANLRSDGPVGSFMSGGLDSSTVSAFAAPLLAKQNARMPVYTFVPEPDWDGKVRKGWYGDETPHVQAIAARYPSMDLNLVTSAGRGMYDWQEELLDAIEQPTRAAYNIHWIHSISAQAAQSGVRTLLSGQMGNFTLSYDGSGLPNALRRQRRYLALARLLGQIHPSRFAAVRAFLATIVKPAMPESYWTRRAQRKTGETEPWRTYLGATTAALEERAVRARAKEKGFSFMVRPIDDVRDRIWTLIEEYYAGTTSAYIGGLRSVHGVDIRDPLADPRLIEWCGSIPHDQFILAGEERSLIKRLTKGILPEDIRLQSHGKGFQPADAHLRMTRDRQRIQSDIAQFMLNDELASLVDLDRMAEIAENWPSTDDFANRPTAFGLLVGTLPTAIQCARFFQRESGRNL